MSDNNAASDELVGVKVPRRHLMAVYGFLATLDRRARADVDTEGTETETSEIRWPVEDLRRFAKTPTTTSNTIGRVLDELADNPDEWVSTSALEAATGIPRSSLKGAFSALTRHLRAHYGGRDWMLADKRGPAIGPGLPAEVHYMLTTEQAERWKDARAAA